MNVKIGIPVAFCCALSLATLFDFSSKAQTPAPPPQPVGVSAQDSANDLVVAVGKSVLVDSTMPVERIAVGSGDFAEATAVSPTEVMINGKAVGETSLIVWQQGGGRQFFNVQVRPSAFAANDKLDSLRRELRTEFPGQTLKLTSENGLVFLRGTVKDLNNAERAVQIASTAGKVVNLLYVNVPAAEPQILLKVRFASLDRSASRQLGLNFYSLGGGNTIGSVTTQQFSPPTITTGTKASGGAPATATTATFNSLLNLFVFRPDLNIGATLEALESTGLVQILAEPNLLTSNGKEGSFLAGGQFPFPVVQGTAGGGGTGAVTIQFKEFGVRMNFIPTITARGTIRLQVAPEVSSLDFANGVQVSGFTVPGLDVRKINTEVELSEGQSFAIGGLLDNRDTKNFSKIPFIGDVPILGKFFQSVQHSRTNTELIVIVTPEIVAPMPVGAALPGIKYPDTFLPPLSNTPMRTPGAEVTGIKPQAPPLPTMPIEKLIQSMQPERPLVIENNMSPTFGTSSGQAGAAAGPPPSAP